MKYIEKGDVVSYHFNENVSREAVVIHPGLDTSLVFFGKLDEEANLVFARVNNDKLSRSRVTHTVKYPEDTPSEPQAYCPGDRDLDDALPPELAHLFRNADNNREYDRG